MKNLKNLISKLDHECKRALEKAVAICLKRHHYHVEIEHWIMAFVQNELSSFFGMIKHQNINVEKLLEDIDHSLEQYKCGNEQAPSISSRIIDWMHEAWLIASLESERHHIQTQHLLKAILKNHSLYQSALGLSQEFHKLDPAVIEVSPDSEDPEQGAQYEPSQKQTSLQQYAIHLNTLAKNGKIDPAIGRENEIHQVIDILQRRRQNNAMLVGEPGVGKTAIVEGLALKIVQGDVPSALQNTQIYTIDMGLLQAGASVKGEFEQRLKSLMQEVKSAATPMILFIDEAHTMIGAGGQEGQNDAANLLKPALARGEFRSIGATTWAEYKKYIEKDPALTRRFQTVVVKEPDTTTAIQMLRSLVPSLEKHHGVKVLDEALISAAELSHRYIAGRQLPDKGISVLDTACSRVAGKHSSQPKELLLAQKQLDALEAEYELLLSEGPLGSMHKKRIKTLKKERTEIEKTLSEINFQWKKEQALMEKIQITIKEGKSIKRLLSLLKKIQGNQALIQPFVDSQVIAEVISDWTGIPMGNIEYDTLHKMLNLGAHLKETIKGQDEAITIISSVLKTSAARLSDPEKPLGVFLMVGPSGVGKTETAHALAETLFGSRDKVVTINMSEFKEAHRVSLLAGSPPGYVGYGEGGILTEAVRRQPYSIILLDEMEKAHPSVQDFFYQVFDKGVLKDGEGRDVSFRNTIILMSSNAADATISKGVYDENTLQNVLLKTFKAAFLGRVKLIPYKTLTKDVLCEIIRAKLARIIKRVKNEYDALLHVPENLEDSLLEQCQQDMLGARQIDALINQTLLPRLSNKCLEATLENKRLKEIVLE